MSKKKMPSASASFQNWRDLYLAALFERDRQKLSSRIAAAERALLMRARELLVTSNHRSEEGKALDKGLYVYALCAVVSHRKVRDQSLIHVSTVLCVAAGLNACLRDVNEPIDRTRKREALIGRLPS